MRAMFLCLSAAVMACSGAEPTGPADPSAVASVTIRPPVTSLLLGSTLSLQVIVRNASGDELTNRPIVFTSSNEQVLTVDSTGLVQALGTGTVTVTARTGGRSGEALIMVTCNPNDCGSPWDYGPVP